MSDQERADHFYRLEQQARIALKKRSAELYEKARRQIDLRIWHYTPGMRRHYQFFVEELHRNMCKEDLRYQGFIDDQQLNLQLAQAYQARVFQAVTA